MQKVQDFNLQL